MGNKEYICGICGKKYTDFDKYQDCVFECIDLELYRREEEKRKKSAAARTDLEKKIKFHYDEFLRLNREFYTSYPSEANDGLAFEIVWPKFEEIVRRL